MLGEGAGEEPGDGDDRAVLVENSGESRRNNPWWCERERAPICRIERKEKLLGGHLWQEFGWSEGKRGKQKQRETR